MNAVSVFAMKLFDISETGLGPVTSSNTLIATRPIAFSLLQLDYAFFPNLFDQ